jgi:membrane-associated phospholipid phosphatase
MSDDPSRRPGRNGGFWHWPSRESLTAFLLAGTASSCWFGLLFGGAEILTAHRSLRVPVHFAWEQGIPLVPEAVWIYMSIYALFLMAPFVLQSPRDLFALAFTHASLVAAAVIGFLVLPARTAFPATGHRLSDGVTTALYRLADTYNLDYNLLPSLHVALSVSCVAIYAPRARRLGQGLLWLWAAAISAATIMTHFHHVLDAVTGLALGLAGARLVYPRAVDRLRGRPTGASGDSTRGECDTRWSTSSSSARETTQL